MSTKGQCGRRGKVMSTEKASRKDPWWTLLPQLATLLFLPVAIFKRHRHPGLALWQQANSREDPDDGALLCGEPCPRDKPPKSPPGPSRDSSPGEPWGTKRQAPSWSGPEIKAVLGLWAEEESLQAMHSTKRRNVDTHARMAEGLAKQGHHPSTLEQVRAKVKELQQGYVRHRTPACTMRSWTGSWGQGNPGLLRASWSLGWRHPYYSSRNTCWGTRSSRRRTAPRSQASRRRRPPRPPRTLAREHQPDQLTRRGVPHLSHHPDGHKEPVGTGAAI